VIVWLNIKIQKMMLRITLIFVLLSMNYLVHVVAFRSPLKFVKPTGTRTSIVQRAKITDNVEFDTIAREWRLKWSDDFDKASLTSVQQLLKKISPALSKIEGVKNVQRVVCGGCHDYKVIVALAADKFADWVKYFICHPLNLLFTTALSIQERTKFDPENEFLESLKSISGVSQVETQTYTLMPVL
jgi:hypothetical protein